VYVCVYVCVCMCYMYVHKYAGDAWKSDAVVVFLGLSGIRIYGYVCLFVYMHVCMHVHMYAGDALENAAIAVCVYI